MASHIEIIARGVLRRGNAVLMCRNDAGGYYYLPGGHVEFGEAAEDALAREFQEECGLDIRSTGLALVSESAFESRGKRHHEVNLVFHVEAAASEVASKEPGISFHWIDFASIVDTDIRPLSARAWLAAGEPSIAWASEVPKVPH